MLMLETTRTQGSTPLQEMTRTRDRVKEMTQQYHQAIQQRDRCRLCEFWFVAGLSRCRLPFSWPVFFLSETPSAWLVSLGSSWRLVLSSALRGACEPLLLLSMMSCSVRGPTTWFQLLPTGRLPCGLLALCRQTMAPVRFLARFVARCRRRGLLSASWLLSSCSWGVLRDDLGCVFRLVRSLVSYGSSSASPSTFAERVQLRELLSIFSSSV